MEKTDSTQSWNISEKKYEQSELHQMWGTCSCGITTLCWLSMVLRTQNTELILTDCKTSITPKNSVHSEVLALRNVEEEIAQKLAFYSQDNSVLDVCCWITNSPCHECQATILEKMKSIQSQSPKSCLRLILFFSNLYCKHPVESTKTDDALERLKDWFLNLAKENITILVGSLIVSRVVPKPETIKVTKIPRLTARKKRDLNSLVYVKKILHKIRPHLSKIKFTSVDSRIPVDENILDEISPSNCPYISIYPIEFPLLSKLTPLIGLELSSSLLVIHGPTHTDCPYISIYPVEFPLLSMLTPLIGPIFGCVQLKDLLTLYDDNSNESTQEIAVLFLSEEFHYLLIVNEKVDCMQLLSDTSNDSICVTFLSFQTFVYILYFVVQFLSSIYILTKLYTDLSILQRRLE